jgi:glycosyltransferase involved in cell wall biosynthesis
VLFVSRTRYRLPPAPSVAAKFDVLREQMDVRVLASAAPGSLTNDETFALVPSLRPRRLDGIAFWLALPWRTAALLREFRPRAVVCQTPYDGAAALLARRLARVPARVVVEVHGDWRTSTRLYGSSSRRMLGRLGDAVAAATLRRADAVRTVSPFTAGLVRELGVEPAADFPAYMDLDPFVVAPKPLPERPVALFVGVLEAYKNVDGLAAAWRLAAPRVPDASLHLVGKGTRTDVAEALVRDSGARWDSELSSGDVAAAMDAAWVLVLPSRSEGMGRVLVEAFCRGRGVIGTRAARSRPSRTASGCSSRRRSGCACRRDRARAHHRALVELLGTGARRRRCGCRLRRNTRHGPGRHRGRHHHAVGGSGALVPARHCHDPARWLSGSTRSPSR